MTKKERLTALSEEVKKRKRALDVLGLLIEDGDAETAIVIGLKLRGDLDHIVAELRPHVGPGFDPESVIASERHAEATGRASDSGAASPPPPPRAPLISDVRRGYLGEEEGGGKLEQWVERGVRGLWHVISNPRRTIEFLLLNKSKIIFGLALIAVSYTAYQAYDKIYLANYGLTGEYYLGTDLKNLFAKRVDHTVDFRWLRKAPIKNYRAEDFSIRWTGYVQADEGGLYEFYTVSDDGVRLWVDDKEIIDNWSVHGGTLDKGEIRLDPGFHKIRLEYYQNAGDMVIKLQWKKPGETWKKVIPARSLFPDVPHA